MVQLYNSGKPRSEIVREYELTPSSLGKWISYYNETGSFKEQD
ncbi:MAG: helix-turn-helix domain-containing protein, partial [Erysipelothrix sp.]|nr:helix-turn-helix domain-containing protein [Erysipelothrix sp.]